MVLFLWRAEALLRPGPLSNFKSNFEPLGRRLPLRTESLRCDFFVPNSYALKNTAEPGERGLRLGLRVKEHYRRERREGTRGGIGAKSRYEASANFRSDHLESEDEIQSRIYRVQCASCGCGGEACGFSAVRILRYKSVETRGTDEFPSSFRPAGKVTRMGLKKELPGAA